MNEGVKILLERMKTNPEEFVPEYDGGVTKWGMVIGHYRTYLTVEDNKALEDAWKETVGLAMQEKFTQAVIKNLLAPEEDSILGKPWYTGHPTGTVLGGTTLGAYSNTSNLTLTTSATASSIQLAQAQQATGTTLQMQETQMQALLNMKKQLELERKEKQKESKTLFGKLFNYL